MNFISLSAWNMPERQSLQHPTNDSDCSATSAFTNGDFFVIKCHYWQFHWRFEHHTVEYHRISLPLSPLSLLSARGHVYGWYSIVCYLTGVFFFLCQAVRSKSVIYVNVFCIVVCKSRLYTRWKHFLFIWLMHDVQTKYFLSISEHLKGSGSFCTM